jgi:hypothetical protein
MVIDVGTRVILQNSMFVRCIQGAKKGFVLGFFNRYFSLLKPMKFCKTGDSAACVDLVSLPVVADALPLHLSCI